MSEPSADDTLHDYYQNIRTTKHGTRYERLAAVVFAAMKRDGTVIHDLKAIGKVSGKKHQIDIYIKRKGVSKRILVECKDFDVSGEKFGLGIVRDFQGVIVDVQPDESWIITCNDSTQSARKYAKGFGIRLATLRSFAAENWENRVQTLVINIKSIHVHEERTSVQIQAAEEYQGTIVRYLGGEYDKDDDAVKIYDAERTVGYGEFLSAVARRVPLDYEESVYSDHRLFNGEIQLPDGSSVPIQGIRVSMNVSYNVTTIKTEADLSAARLLLGNNEGLDFVLWEDAISGYHIDQDTGKTVLGDQMLQKRLTTRIVGPIVL